jgi:uncharacterized protein (DUF427 family)
MGAQHAITPATEAATGYVLAKLDWMARERIWPNGLRYLWTDAFGIVLFVSLYRELGESKWLDRAEALVADVEHVLGRPHGLRIGKAPERDGQYFHYLAMWLFALQRLGELQDHIAFDWDKVDRWFEEDEEIFGHPRDPHHRVDVRPGSRTVEVGFGGETIASTRRGMFLFETGMPPRYYIPLEDVRANLLAPSSTSTICPYKGTASYWHLRVGGRAVDDAVWAYLDPLSDCPRIKGYLCFDPEKVDRLEVDLPRIANRTIEDVLAA